MTSRTRMVIAVAALIASSSHPQAPPESAFGGVITFDVGVRPISRVNSTRIAGRAVKGSEMAFDAILPFRDGLDATAAVGHHRRQRARHRHGV